MTSLRIGNDTEDNKNKPLVDQQEQAPDEKPLDVVSTSVPQQHTSAKPFAEEWQWDTAGAKYRITFSALFPELPIVEQTSTSRTEVVSLIRHNAGAIGAEYDVWVERTGLFVHEQFYDRERRGVYFAQLFDPETNQVQGLTHYNTENGAWSMMNAYGENIGTGRFSLEGCCSSWFLLL